MNVRRAAAILVLGSEKTLPAITATPRNCHIGDQTILEMKVMWLDVPLLTPFDVRGANAVVLFLFRSVLPL